MKRQARSSKDSLYGPPAETAVARVERPSTSSYGLSRDDENDYHRPAHSYSYARSQIAAPDLFEYYNEEDEVPPVLQRLPSQERVPQSDFLSNADLVLDDPLQRWKMIEEGRDFAPGNGRDYRRQSRHSDMRAALGGSVAGVAAQRHSPSFYPPHSAGNAYGTSSSYAHSNPRYGRDVAIVSPIFDDYCGGEQSLSSRNSLQRSTNSWDDVKPPPFSANDHLYHHNHYREESYHPHHRFPADTSSYGSREYHSRGPSREPVVQQTVKMMEISPGSFVRLRGADETYQAVANDFYTPCQCMICSSSSSPKRHRASDDEPLFCIQDADFFLCPNCKSICPLEDDVSSNPRNSRGGDGGVGLGFTLEMLIQIQEEIVSNRATAAH